MNQIKSFSSEICASSSNCAKRHGVRRQAERDAAFGQRSTHKSGSLDEPATALQSGVTATALQHRAVVRAVHGGTGRPTDSLTFSRNVAKHFSSFVVAVVQTALVLFLFSFCLAVVAPAQSTNDSSATDFSSFQVIVDRNIFNPDRYGSTGNDHPRSYSVPAFSLAGTMSYRKGMFAFFNGTSDEYRKALQEGGTIAGYTIGKITFDSVQLESAGVTNTMKVGAAMRRQGSEWVLSAPGEWGDLSASGNEAAPGSDTSGGTSTNAPSSTSSPSSGAESDVLKRLMEKREQELK